MMEQESTMTFLDWLVNEMAEQKYFPVFFENEDIISELSDEQAGVVFKALFRLNSDAEEVPEDLSARIAYKALKRQIEASKAHYEEVCRKRSEAGRKGNEVRWSDDRKCDFCDDEGSQTVAKIAKTKTKTKTKTNTDIDTVVSLWNSLKEIGIIPVRAVSEGSKRRQQLSARLKQYTVEDFEKAIVNIRASKFLQGQNDRGWRITFDWFIMPSNFQKVLEGNYTDRTPSKVTPIKGVSGMSSRSYDWAALERDLICAQGID